MIINFGSLNVDMVLNVSALPGPGETVLCPEYKLFPGGKGANQAVAAARAGSDVFMYGCIGNDDFGRLIQSSLQSAGVQTEGVRIVNKPTGCAMICVDHKGENMITVASGANQYAVATDVPTEAENRQAILLLQMETPSEENWILIERFKGKVILNLAPSMPLPERILRKISVLVMNEGEARNLGLHLRCKEMTLKNFAQYLQKHYDITVVITLGSKGCCASSSEGFWEIPAIKIDAVDTTAAGDAFVGVLAASLDQGHCLKQSLQYAIAASGLACMKRGAQPSLPFFRAIELAAK